MKFSFNSLNKTQKGAVALLFGILVLLYAFNIMQRVLTSIVIISGGACVWYGLSELGITSLIKSKFFKAQ